MINATGYTWEYIAWNMDLHRIRALTEEWKDRPSLNTSMNHIVAMVKAIGGFEDKQRKRSKSRVGTMKAKKQKECLFPANFPSLDPSKWTVVSEQRWG